MSKELFRTRCTKGHLVVYDDKVAIELKGMGVDNSESLKREQITGVDVNTTTASLFGLGGSATVTINGTGDKSIEAKMVKIKDAQKIRELTN
jgi:hypothetical protein